MPNNHSTPELDSSQEFRVIPLRMVKDHIFPWTKEHAAEYQGSFTTPEAAMKEAINLERVTHEMWDIVEIVDGLAYL